MVQGYIIESAGNSDLESDCSAVTPKRACTVISYFQATLYSLVGIDASDSLNSHYHVQCIISLVMMILI